MWKGGRKLKKMEELVSVIVPVYNVEKYLEKCILSIINQTYKNLEIILVDDESPDNCGKICDNYAEKDKRIQVIHKENGGLSSARNIGFNVASGKYIIFVDSDDYLYDNAIEILVYHMYKKIDFVHFYAVNFNEQYEISKENEEYYVKKNTYEGIYEGYRLLIKLLKNKDFRSPVQLYLFRKSFLKNNNLMFHEGIIHEDEEFMIRAFIRAHKCMILPLVLYAHRIRNDSIMGVKIGYKNTNGLYSGLIQVIDEYEKSDEIYKEAYEVAIFHLLKLYFQRLTASSDKYKECSRIQTKQIKKVISKQNLDYVKLKVKIYLIFYSEIEFLKRKGVKKLLQKAKKNIAIKSRIIDKQSKSILKKLNSQHKNRIIVLCVPHNHSNRGDIAISLAQKDFINASFPKHELIEVPTQLCEYHASKIAKLIKDEDMIFICGGGWFGSLWRHNQVAAMSVLKRCPNNKIIVFPQTIYYTNDKNGNRELKSDTSFFRKLEEIYFCVRDKESFECISNNNMLNEHSTILYLPDMVLTYLPKINKKDMPRQDKISVCLRNDMERVLSFEMQNKIVEFLTNKAEKIEYFSSNQRDNLVSMVDREKSINEFLKQFITSKLIVTDRLHCMIFALITGTPCIAFDNKTGKVSGVYEWIKQKEYIKVVKNFQEFESVFKTLHFLEYDSFQEYYVSMLTPIIEIVKEGE